MLKTLRLDPWGKHASVIALTNLTAEHKDEVLKFGVQDYLVKAEWSLEKIVQIVEKACG